MSGHRWPMVRLVFDENVNKVVAVEILDRFRRQFIIRAPTFDIRTRQRGAFRVTVQVHPKREADFRMEVEHTQGVNIDE